MKKNFLSIETSINRIFLVLHVDGKLSSLEKEASSSRKSLVSLPVPLPRPSPMARAPGAPTARGPPPGDGRRPQPGARGPLPRVRSVPG